MIYQASRDGFRAQDFHSKCDNYNNTLIVIKSSFSNIFGGFTTANWTGERIYKNDPNAFIFSLVNQHNTPTKLNVIDSNKAIQVFSNYGPVFGVSDLVITNMSNVTYSDSFSYLGRSYQLPASFEYESLDMFSYLDGYGIRTVEIEVYSIEGRFF